MAWDHVEMHVEHVLSCRLAVREEEVHSLAPDRGGAKRGRDLPTGAKDRRSVLRVQIGQRRGMPPRDDESVPAHERLDVHEDDRPVVLVDERQLAVARDEAAEQAVRHAAASATKAAIASVKSFRLVSHA
jgi:hypothetical protein